MTYYLTSNRSEIKLSEVILKKILTDAELNFKFLVLKGQNVAHTSEIECIDLKLHICCFTDEEKITLKGEKLAMVQVVSLVKDYYGSLSDFRLSNESGEKSLSVVGNTSKEEIVGAF